MEQAKERLAAEQKAREEALEKKMHEIQKHAEAHQPSSEE